MGKTVKRILDPWIGLVVLEKKRKMWKFMTMTTTTTTDKFWSEKLSNPSTCQFSPGCSSWGLTYCRVCWALTPPHTERWTSALGMPRSPASSRIWNNSQSVRLSPLTLLCTTAGFTCVADYDSLLHSIFSQWDLDKHNKTQLLQSYTEYLCFLSILVTCSMEKKRMGTLQQMTNC